MSEPQTNEQKILEQNLRDWELWKKRAQEAVIIERKFRETVLKSLFPSGLTEGTNKAEFEFAGSTEPRFADAELPLTGKVRFTVTQPYDRKIDEGTLAALVKAARMTPEELAAIGANPSPLAGVNFDDVIRRKPELATAEYRKLTEAQTAVFDACLVVKPGSPQVVTKTL